MKTNKSKKILKPFFVLLLTLLFAMPIFAFAEDDEVFDGYFAEHFTEKTTVLTLESDGGEIAKRVNDLVKAARTLASDENPVLIVIPAHEYTLNAPIRLYSNVNLYAVGATFSRLGDTGNLVVGGGKSLSESHSGYDDYQNITIIGGTWKKSTENLSNIFYFIHGKNIKFIDCSFDGGEGEKLENNHLVEVSAIDGFTVSGCSFKNNRRPQSKIDADTTCGGYESLQLDTATFSATEPLYVYDGTPSKNILIENCTFENVSRGIGTHTAIFGVYRDNIIIRNNTFNNVTDEAILAYNYKNCKIIGNTINAGRGIQVLGIGKNDNASSILSMYLNAKVEPDEGIYEKGFVNNLNIEIRNNNIVAISKNKTNYSFGIDVYGSFKNDISYCGNVNGGKDTLPAGDYQISGITVSNNTISTNGVGVKLEGVNSSTVSKNTIFKNSENKTVNTSVSYGILTKNQVCEIDDGNSFVGNTISDFDGAGIYCCEKTITKNIDRNTISGTKIDGIRIVGATISESVSENEIIGAKGYGILLKEKANIPGSISKNIVTSPSSDGIRISASTVSGNIDENTISSAKAYGIIVKDSATVSGIISTNTINTPIADGIRIDGSTVGGIDYNKITKPKAYGILIKGKATINADLRKNTIETSAVDAIKITESSKVLGSVVSNVITAPKGVGINLCSKAYIKKHLASNTVTKSTSDSIRISDSAKVYGSVQKNKISSSLAVGIFFKNTGKCSGAISKNQITKSALESIRIDSSSIVTGTISENTIENSNNVAILVKNAKVGALTKNKIVAPKFQGILLSDSAETTGGITSNTLEKTGSNSIEIKNCTISKITSNTVVSAGVSAIRVNTITAPLTVSKNNLSGKRPSANILIKTVKKDHLVKITENIVVGEKKSAGIRVESGKFYLKSNTISKCAKAFASNSGTIGEIYSNTLKDNLSNKYSLNADKTVKSFENIKAPKLTLKRDSKTSIKATSEKLSGVTGYEFLYSKSSSMSSPKTLSSSKNVATLSKLTSGKKYYVRARGIGQCGSVTVYGAYCGKVACA